HLDDSGQALANAVPGGAAATLGDTAAVELTDPTEIGGGRFGGAVSFITGQHVAWPTALAAAPAVTVELWANPTVLGGSLFASSDGSVTVRVAPASPTTVQFSASIGSGTATSAAVAAGAWHYVVASADASDVHLWVDGVRTDVTMAAAPPFGFDAITLGGTYGGAIDEVWFSQAATTTDDAALAGYCPM
ncbi:MAG TPA: LamG-like jellyroll fold domain-containing protein, partial [Kofleriaceae bacterium]|nr:LamG-like jellyroll fold domain-containing protein [Kofleriaceae bacterium]